MNQKPSGQMWLCERAKVSGAEKTRSKDSASLGQGSTREASQFLVPCWWLYCELGS